MFRFRVLLPVLCMLLVNIVKTQYKIIPEVLVEALSPRGLRISIPDQRDLKKFVVHANINIELREKGEVTFSESIKKPTNGRWTFFDESAMLQIGDIIYYRIKVDYFDGTEKINFQKNLNFTVVELVSEENNGTINNTTILTPVFPTQQPTIEATQTTIHISATTPTLSTSTEIPVSSKTSTGVPQTTTQKPTTKATSNTTQNPDCKPTPTIVNGKPSCRDKLIFQESFSEISEKKWQAEVRFPQEPDYEFVIYQDHSDNLFLNKSMLYVRPTLVDERWGNEFVTQPAGLDLGDNCTGVPESYECRQKPVAWKILPPILSAQISTKDRFSFVYGIVEIRARFPKGDWIYPQLFLKSRSDYYGPGYDSGLIRIAFTPGNANLSKQLSGGCILGESIVARNYGIKSIKSVKDWNSDFHIFRMVWTPGRIELSVDNIVYGNIYPPDGGFAEKQQELNIDSATARRWKRGSQMAPFDKEMYLALGVGVGGYSFADKKDGSKPWQNDDPKSQLNFYKAQNNWRKTWTNNTALIVDYIKIWAL